MHRRNLPVSIISNATTGMAIIAIIVTTTHATEIVTATNGVSTVVTIAMTATRIAGMNGVSMHAIMVARSTLGLTGQAGLPFHRSG